MKLVLLLTKSMNYFLALLHFQKGTLNISCDPKRVTNIKLTHILVRQRGTLNNVSFFIRNDSSTTSERNCVAHTVQHWNRNKVFFRSLSGSTRASYKIPLLDLPWKYIVTPLRAVWICVDAPLTTPSTGKEDSITVCEVHPKSRAARCTALNLKHVHSYDVVQTPSC